MTIEQENALRASIQEILGVEIDDGQLEQLCDVLMFGYPPSVLAMKEEQQTRSIVWEQVRLAKMHGCSSLSELFYEVYPRLCEETGLSSPDDETCAFFDSVLAYFNAHPEQFENAFA